MTSTHDAFTLPVVTCIRCGKLTDHYGRDLERLPYCYDCCADLDRESMQSTGRATLYLIKTDRERQKSVGCGTEPVWEITNWPGTLRYTCTLVRKGHHNIARTRYDAWFTDEYGAEWHGVNIGDNDICRCRRLKTVNKAVR